MPLGSRLEEKEIYIITYFVSEPNSIFSLPTRQVTLIVRASSVFFTVIFDSIFLKIQFGRMLFGK